MPDLKVVPTGAARERLQEIVDELFNLAHCSMALSKALEAGLDGEHLYGAPELISERISTLASELGEARWKDAGDAS